MVRDMRNRFLICLIFTVPIFVYSPMGGMFEPPTPPFGLKLDLWLFFFASAAILYPSWPSLKVRRVLDGRAGGGRSLTRPITRATTPGRSRAERMALARGITRIAEALMSSPALSPPAADEPYGRCLLFADDAREVLAMSWRPGATCAPHDHGASGGVVHLIAGRIVERRYAFDGARLTPIGESCHEAPAVLAVAPGIIHDIHAAPGAETVLTIHHYEPRIAAMRVYDDAGRRTLVVSDDCGAWIPRDPALVREVIAWDAPTPRDDRAR